MKDHYQVLIVGGGTAGLSVAAQLRAVEDPPEIAIVEPSTKHYYQPLWTLVGGGVFPREDSVRDEAELIPDGVTWIRDRVESFDPDRDSVTVASGRTLRYDALVVAAGVQLDWDRIPGLLESLGQPGTGVCSNYSYDSVSRTWETIRAFRGGTALFTEPGTPVKCGGAPQKIMYLADEAFRRSGVRDRSHIAFYNAKASLFSSPYYIPPLTGVIERKGIEVKLEHELTELRPASREAVFRDLRNGTEVVVGYDMIHVTPPMSAPDFIKQSPLAGAGGWVDVDRHTLRHVRYPNVYGLGDSSSLPTSKTGAAIRKQAPVVVANLLASLRGAGEDAAYDGYTSCPLVTGYGKLILAEFDYDKQPAESFPFDQRQERYSMYALKAYALPQIYWHGMLRGRM
jgi:sulfide:quinone oxidoreductase